MDSRFGSGISHKVFILQSMQIACSVSPHSNLNNKNPNENSSAGKMAWLVRKGQRASQIPLETVGFSPEPRVRRPQKRVSVGWLERRMRAQQTWPLQRRHWSLCFPRSSWNSLLSSWWFGQCFLKNKKRQWYIWSGVFFSPHNSWLHFLIVIATKNQRNLYWKCNCVEILIQIQTRSSDTSQSQNWGNFLCA